MKWLIAIATAFFQALLPWVAGKSRPTAEDGDRDKQTADKLRDKVRKHWGTSKPEGEDGWSQR